jgi:tetratricopeptide (TPR) repeat protein
MRALVLFLVLQLAPPPGTALVQQLLESAPADNLAGPLRRFEAAHHGGAAAEAALTLGQLHYARGEYRQAAESFARAAAHFDPSRKAEARYWAGLAWLGAGDPSQARSFFEEAARGESRQSAGARLGVALCWEQAQRPERALETLQSLVANDPDEAGPAALEHLAALATRLDRPELARRARDRLVHDYPSSIEAMRAELAPAATATARPPAAPRPRPAATAPVARPAPPPAAVHGPFTVQIGAFRDAARAAQLAERARRGGFTPVRVSALEDAGGALYAVRVGVYATAEDARDAGARLGRALTVAWRVVSAP